MQIDMQKTANMFKAFCDENRVRILLLLTTGEKCACRLLEEISIAQSTLSHHMKILCDSGIVAGRKEGKWMYYCLSAEGVAYAAKCFEALTKVDNTQKDKSCQED